jgi:hypothetical protein
MACSRFGTILCLTRTAPLFSFDCTIIRLTLSGTGV